MPIVVASVLALLVLASALLGNAPDVGSRDEGTAMCHQFIEDRLRAPATAEFTDVEVLRRVGGWRVVGHVDAENAFGALLRTEFRCDVDYVGNGQWRLEDLETE